MTVLESVERTFKNQLSRLYQPKSKWQETAWEKTWEIGFPHPGGEDCRHLRLRELYDLNFEENHSSELTKEKIMEQVPLECQGSFLVFVNGVFQEKFSSTHALPKGVLTLPFSSALRSFGAFLTPHMAKMLKEEKDPFVLLNAALFEEGAFLYAPPKVHIEVPLFVLHWIENETGDALFSPRFHIFASKDSSAKVIFKQETEKGSSQWVNSVFDVTVEEKAHLDFFSLGDESNKMNQAWHFSAVRASLRKESALKSVSIVDGTRSLRQDYKISLIGEQAEASIYGASMLQQNQGSHVNIFMDHQEPFCRSLQKFKGVLNGASRASFHGKINVSKRALKTEAYQMNNTLLLSEKAITTSKPMLEILADDVKASHGATVGQLDVEELFYLKSRGLLENEARQLLVLGFCKEIIDLIPLPSLVKEAVALNEEALR